jgi:hypothetical protein
LRVAPKSAEDKAWLSGLSVEEFISRFVALADKFQKGALEIGRVDFAIFKGVNKIKAGVNEVEIISLSGQISKITRIIKSIKPESANGITQVIVAKNKLLNGDLFKREKGILHVNENIMNNPLALRAVLRATFKGKGLLGEFRQFLPFVYLNIFLKNSGLEDIARGLKSEALFVRFKAVLGLINLIEKYDSDAKKIGKLHKSWEAMKLALGSNISRQVRKINIMNQQKVKPVLGAGASNSVKAATDKVVAQLIQALLKVKKEGAQAKSAADNNEPRNTVKFKIGKQNISIVGATTQEAEKIESVKQYFIPA